MAMEWTDHGIVVRVRKSGERGLIVDYFTRQHGRHSGYVRAGNSAKTAGLYQLGTCAQVTWRARLDQHLGTFTCEPLTQYPACFLRDRQRLFALQSVTALLSHLPERAAYPQLYDGFCALLDCFVREDHGRSETFLAALAVFELHLLSELGFGLDLRACAVTGSVDNLRYLSPRTGRAVTEDGAGAYKARLLEIPELVFVWHMLCSQNMSLKDVFELMSEMSFHSRSIHETFVITGLFLEKFILAPQGLEHADVRSHLLKAA